MAATLAKAKAMICIRNTMLENLHEGEGSDDKNRGFLRCRRP